MAWRCSAASLRRLSSSASRQAWCGGGSCISMVPRWQPMRARSRSSLALLSKRTWRVSLAKLALNQHNEARHDWIEQLGAQDRQQTSRGYQRVADLQVSTTDPDATLMLTKNGADLGYHTHYVVDGGKSRIILNVLVTPSEVMDNQPMLDLLWRTRFRWKLWPRQVTGDRKYGTEDNLVAIEDQGIRAYIPIPDMDHRTEYFSADQFRYEAERDVYR